MSGNDAAKPMQNALAESRAHPIGVTIFVATIAGAAFYFWASLTGEISDSGQTLSTSSYVALGVALLLALGFEFVNGFHDTANAVATVIYTKSLPPTFAVIWSGVWNFLGVLTSVGLVAYSIIALLPVELILQVGTAGGYAMIFALLVSATLWNLITWYFGIPNSSSHCLIGSVLGVGLANQLMAPAGYATSGVDWAQAQKVGKALLFSPFVGFALAAILLLIFKAIIPNKKLFQEPGDSTPPWWVRATLIATCTGVSFAHGGNDGQKGMGLIMLVLIGAAPAAFALNRALPASETAAIIRSLDEAANAAAPNAQAASDIAAARDTLGEALRTKKIDETTDEAFAALAHDLARRLETAGSIKDIAPEATSLFRSDLYVVGEAAQRLEKSDAVSADAKAMMKPLSDHVKKATRFIPDWVKIAVAFSLGLGTMVGWRRIVVTVGEKIGKAHMTYAQGAAAETIAAVTILGAQQYGLPVSTTHVLSSGVAGTMAANGSGLQWKTIGQIAGAWIFTLPVVICLSGFLYFIGMQIAAGQ